MSVGCLFPNTKLLAWLPTTRSVRVTSTTLDTRPPSDAVPQRWCAACPLRPDAAPSRSSPPTCRARTRSTTQASSIVETKAGMAGQPEHTCQLDARGWRPPCACSGAGGACWMAGPSCVESKLAPPPRPAGSMEAPRSARACLGLPSSLGKPRGPRPARRLARA